MENRRNHFHSELNINGKREEEAVESEGEYFSDADANGADDDIAIKKPAVESEKQTVDEAVIIEKEKLLTDLEKEQKRLESLQLKDLGNNEFKSCSYETAVNHYTDAIAVCLLIHAEERAVLYSNRAAAYIKLSKNDKALEDCEKSVSLNPSYVRARLRRAELYEKVDKLDEALEDYKKVLEQDPRQHSAREACMRLPEQIKMRNEKMKDEMIGKLKDLGNMFLKPFGLSTNNFKMQQDPGTGSYSINFQQNPRRDA